MALIADFHHEPDRTVRFTTSTDCGWTAGLVDGRPVLSLKTFGGPDRQLPGKGSQNIELDETAAAALMTLIRTVFPQLA